MILSIWVLYIISCIQLPIDLLASTAANFGDAADDREAAISEAS